ncbi:proteasome assembly chaperone 2 [Gorgonomyces haynaldii]|nr:proteasome assembly chaperone 2 [Gorgonomyces haynaldii]
MSNLFPGPNQIAYVGQLSLDLIIQSCGFKRVGFLSSPLVEPLVAMNVYGQGQLYTPFEVYQNHGFTIVQLRSPVLKGYGIEFASTLADWAQQFNQVFVLTSFDQSRRSDVQLRSVPFRVHHNNLSESMRMKVQLLDWIPLEPFENEFAEHPTVLPPGGGLTRFLLDEFEKKKRPFCILGWFTGRGDNSLVAHALADHLDQLLDLKRASKIDKWTVPVSWTVLQETTIEPRMF